MVNRIIPPTRKQLINYRNAHTTSCAGNHRHCSLYVCCVQVRHFLLSDFSNLVRVAVFAKGEQATAAEAAGADVVGAEDLVARIQNEGFLDFDVAIAAPDCMGLVGRLGKVLGPRGLMPSPKAGTVTPDVAKAVDEAKAGKIEYRLDKTNIIHCPIGKASFGAEKLTENLDALMEAIVKAKPAATKGQYIKSCTVASTMGPGIRYSASKYAVTSADKK